jgi:formate dehydrogenase subunit gamma
VHAASFVVIGVFLIVHLYLSLLPMNRQALNAMFGDGSLPIDYVKSHHPIWYEKLTGKRAESVSAEKDE